MWSLNLLCIFKLITVMDIVSICWVNLCTFHCLYTFVPCIFIINGNLLYFFTYRFFFLSARMLSQLCLSLGFDICPVFPHYFTVSLLSSISPLLSCFSFGFSCNCSGASSFVLRLSWSWISLCMIPTSYRSLLTSINQDPLVFHIRNMQRSSWSISPSSCMLCSCRKQSFSRCVCYAFHILLLFHHYFVTPISLFVVYFSLWSLPH